jgi:predicted PP-loop superfamily ATPase
VKFNNRRTYDQRRSKTHGYHSRKLCQVCRENRGVVNHHLITVKNGGYDAGNNRIQICSKCHEKIHPWMGERKKKAEVDKASLAMDKEFAEICGLKI